METSLSRTPRRAAWLAAVAALWAPAVPAVTTSWVGPANGNWETAANWSAGVPKSLDTALVTPLTRSVLNLNKATTIAGLTMSNASLVTFADLTVTGAVSWIDDTAQVPLLALQSGSTVRFQGTVTLGGHTGKTLAYSGVLDLSGATTWTGNTVANGNSLTLGLPTGSAPVLRNRGAFTDANAVDTSITGRGTFDNQGSFIKTGASATRIDVANFLNSGSVTVTGGSLVLPAMTGVHSGSWQVDAGAVIDFAGGTPTLLGTLGGSGTLRFSGGTVTVEGFGHNVPMLLDGGALAGSYQVFDGPVTWRTGTIAGSGTTLLTGALTLDGNGSQVIASGRQVISYGQTIWSSPTQLTFGNGGGLPSTFTNLGEFRDAGVGKLVSYAVSAEHPNFVNAGTYVKTGNTSTYVNGVPFDNQGTLDVRAGALRLNASPMTNSGLIQTAAGAGLSIDVGSGPMENSGTLAGDGQIAALASIINRGLISPGSPIGTLDLYDVTLAPEGTLKIELGAAGAHDLLLTGTVVLGGTLDLWDIGYAPRIGDSISVLQFNARQGTSVFDAIQFHGFAPQVAFDVLYEAGDVRLVVTAVPEPAAASLWLAGLALMGVALRRGPSRGR